MGFGGFTEQVKRKAPVTGPMRRGEIDVVDYARAIEGAGVAAIAVNTDRNFFGCTYEDLTSIRVSRAPVLFTEKRNSKTPATIVVERNDCFSKTLKLKFGCGGGEHRFCFPFLSLVCKEKNTSASVGASRFFFVLAWVVFRW